MEENIVFSTEDVEQNKAFGILAYFGILVLVPIFGANDSPYARFHANQGLVYFIVTIAAYFAKGILNIVFRFIPLFGSLFSALLSLCIGIFCLIMTIIGIINACSGEAKKLPIIGNITIYK